MCTRKHMKVINALSSSRRTRVEEEEEATRAVSHLCEMCLQPSFLVLSTIFSRQGVINQQTPQQQQHSLVHVDSSRNSNTELNWTELQCAVLLIRITKNKKNKSGNGTHQSGRDCESSKRETAGRRRRLQRGKIIKQLSYVPLYIGPCLTQVVCVSIIAADSSCFNVIKRTQEAVTIIWRMGSTLQPLSLCRLLDFRNIQCISFDCQSCFFCAFSRKVITR